MEEEEEEGEGRGGGRVGGGGGGGGGRGGGGRVGGGGGGGGRGGNGGVGGGEEGDKLEYSQLELQGDITDPCTTRSTFRIAHSAQIGLAKRMCTYISILK